MEENKRNERLDLFSFGLVASLGFLLPIFFIPLQGFPVEAGKGFLVGFFTIISFALWILSRLIDGQFVLPKSPLFWGMLGLVLSALLSSVFSAAPFISLIGRGFEAETLSFFVIALLLLFLSSLSFRSGERVFYFYGAFLAAAVVTALYHVIRLVAGPGALSFGLFGGVASTWVGKWNDLAIFFGAAAVLSLVTAEMLILSRRLSVFLYAVIAVCLFFLALVNFTLVWAIVGTTALILVIYGVYSNRQVATVPESTSPVLRVGVVRLPAASIAVTLISVIFFLGANSFGVSLANRFGATQLEVRPSLSTTLELAKGSLSDKTHFLFGVGANRFVSQWLMHKPSGINASPFWNTDFNSGFGIVPASLVTLGLLGFLSWIAFLAAFLYLGFRALFNFSLPRPERYLVVSSFTIAAYLWAFVVLYVPSIALYSLAFIFTGILVASLLRERLIGRYEWNLLGEPKKGFFSVLLLIFMLIGTVSLGYIYSQKLVSLVYFQRSLVALNKEGSVEKTEGYLKKALAFSNDDIYHRAASELDLIKLNNLVRETNVPQDTLRAQFQAILGDAIENAKTAANIDASNYANFLSLGRVYEAIVPLNIQGSYEAAKDAYQKALAVNPESPAILLSLARLEIAHKDVKAARAMIARALEKKQNFTEAIFLLSQLEAQEGNIAEAIKKTEEASLLAPDDVSVFFQLGLLKYQNRDNAGAISALERAIALSPNYSNAKYFLGLSYYRVDRDKDAIKQFEDIAALNPDNQEVKTILANLRAGKSPFAGTAPPQSTPEKRQKPPIEE